MRERARRLELRRPACGHGGAAAIPLGGGKGVRTPDLLHAMQALSQLSYTPEVEAILWRTEGGGGAVAY